MKHLLTLRDLSRKEIQGILDLAVKIKNNKKAYSSALQGKTLLMIFAKPSLRTRLSFEQGMYELGGHAIHYDLSTSPMGKKESVSDTARIATLYVHGVMARLYEHSNIVEFAKYSKVPVINGLTNFTHPCQIVSDLLTIQEHFGNLKNKKVVYLGDSNNNVTHSLLFGCSVMGVDISVACPNKKEFAPLPEVVEFAKKQGVKVEITDNPVKAVKGAHVLYTDSWMSYHIPDSEKAGRLKILKPFQINELLMKRAAKNAVFMHCLPAERGMEVTAGVIDGKQSIIEHQAENRLHAQKAILVELMRKK